MKRIAVIGLGNFGTALARNWIVAGHDVRGWTVEQEVFNSINALGVNEKYLSDVSLDGIRVSMDIASTIEGADIVVLALPSGVILSVVDDVIPYVNNEQIHEHVTPSYVSPKLLRSTACLIVGFLYMLE